MNRSGSSLRFRKAWLQAFLAVLGMTSALSAQSIIENPVKPKAANAGRVVTPQEVLIISDEGTGDYYFKWPHGLRPGPEGSLLSADVDQVLWFEKSGRFIGNLFKKGQGPGEMPWLGAPVGAGQAAVVFSAAPGKLVYFDRTGRYAKEMPVRSEGGQILTLIGWQSGRFYFESGAFPRTTGDPGVVDNPRTIVAVSEPDGAIASLATFVTRAWVVTSPGGGGGMFDVTKLIAVPFGGKYLALTHTEDYLIKLFDPATNKVVGEFRRAYARVKGEPLTEAEKKGGLILNGKHYTRPERKFENDIKNLLVRSGEIWAVTSTKDKAKGILVDVFDGEGVYRDCFWLRLPEAAIVNLVTPGRCAFDGEFLWVAEQAGDETYSIKKYRVAPAQTGGTVPRGLASSTEVGRRSRSMT
jgi:hypothetical protein